VRRVVIWLAVVCGAVLSLWALMFVFQAKLVWFPGPPPELDPRAVGLAFRDVPLESADGERLGAWLVEPAAGVPGRGVVLHCHGNAGNIAGRIEHARVLARDGWAVLLVDYRVYCRSTGKPREEGTYLDAQAAFDWLVAEGGFRPDQVVLWGESLGGAVAVELAGRCGGAALVLESTFTSVPDLGAEVYPWIPVRLLARIRYDSLARVPALELPVLVAHGERDEIVPFAHGERLFEAARGPKRFVRTDGGHNVGGPLLDEAARGEVLAFLREHVAPR
jgi:fermentation-respiration switch protein FrsA (DUF1100 family)